MAGDGCEDRSRKPLPTPKKAPLQARYKDSEKEGEVDDEDDGEQRKGKNEPHKLPDGFYMVEALRKKRVRQVGLYLIRKMFSFCF